MSRSSTFSVESMEDFFSKTGPLPPVFDDSRRFARFYYRTCAEALIHPPVGEQSEATKHYVLTRDLSRGGVGIIHSEQLLPGQRIEIFLDGKPARSAVVVWCRRVGEKCYSIGCRFEIGK